MGMIARAAPGRVEVYPSVARTTVFAAHRAPSAVEHVRKDLVDLRLLEYPRSLPFDGLREAAHEARRVQRRAVRRVRRADGVRRVENRPRRFLSEQREVLLADTGHACFVDLGAGAARTALRCGRRRSSRLSQTRIRCLLARQQP